MAIHSRSIILLLKSPKIKVCLHMKQISNVICLIQKLNKNVISLPPTPKCYLFSWPPYNLSSLLAPDFCSNFLLNFQSCEFLLLNRPFSEYLALPGMVGIVRLNWPHCSWVPMYFPCRVSTLTSLGVTWT